jgi:hypothetical protein
LSPLLLKCVIKKVLENQEGLKLTHELLAYADENT